VGETSGRDAGIRWRSESTQGGETSGRDAGIRRRSESTQGGESSPRPPYVDNAVEGWGYLRVSGDGPRHQHHSGQRSVEEWGELGMIASTPIGPDARFSTIHRTYYDYNPFSNR
jgi:hypothetical protein